MVIWETFLRSLSCEVKHFLLNECLFVESARLEVQLPVQIKNKSKKGQVKNILILAGLEPAIP